MARDQDVSESSSTTAVDPQETTPLLPKEPPKWGKSVVYRVLLTAFMVSLSFGVTQVPLIYVFGLMTCDEYYKTRPLPGPGIDRCRNHAIEAGTARAVALLGTGTTLFGVVNLFFTGWAIKRYGVKSALLISVFWPAVRLAVQNIGVQTGYGPGIIIIQASQIITVVGGPAGYLLALNSFATEVVEPAERTATMGRLSGFTMFGTAIGFLAGGLISDAFGIIAPFRVTLVLFLISSLYVVVFLPWIPHNKEVEAKASKSIGAFFEPIKMFVPQKWVLLDGRIRREYGVLFLGLGAFFAVLATGYVPVLLQMYSTDVYGFGTRENGFLICLNSLIRGLFLTLAFPPILSKGRKWLDKRTSSSRAESRRSSQDGSAIPDLPTDAAEFADIQGMENEQEPVEPPKPEFKEETFAFDLLFTRYSIMVDGILTGAATFITQGWQMYLVAVLLPLASGTGPAAKGTILQMCPASQRADALSAISLIEMIARLSTTSIFGLIFSAFATIGKPYLTFTCNAACALLAFCILIFSRFPPQGSTRYTGEEEPSQEENT